MSFDPFAADSELPDAHGFASPTSGIANAGRRVSGPAIALIVVGVVNMLMMVVQVGRFIQQSLKPAQELMKESEDQIEAIENANILPKEFFDQYRQQQRAKSPDDMKNQALLTGGGASALGLLIASLTLFGGIRMRSLRSYALSVAGAISAAIPCLSCGGTCCFGQIIGIWALIVLLNAEVRAAFQ